MKDIDFDELDRAVNSLMGTAPKGEPTKNADEAATSDDATTSATTVEGTEVPAPSSTPGEPEVSKPAEEVTPTPELVPQPEPADSPAPTPSAEGEHNEQKAFQEAAAEPDTQATETPRASAASAAVPSRGRFMDMVRPSARDTNRPAPSLPISRRGTTLQPSASAMVTAPSDSTEKPTDTASDQSAAATPAQDIESLTAGSEPMEDTTTAPAKTPAEPADNTAPLDSPFLPDAKVEKRPLGRPAEPAEPAAPAVDLSGELAKEKSDTETPSIDAPPVTEPAKDKDAQLPEQPLPAELDSSLLSIETDTTTATQPEEKPAAEAAEAPKVPETSETKAALTPDTNTEKAPPATSATPEASGAGSTPPATMPDPIRTMPSTSIPQQYKLQTEAKEESPVGGIYDTQPLAHPAEKKPGWMLIVAIVAILILGAAGGAAVYYLGLL